MRETDISEYVDSPGASLSAKAPKEALALQWPCTSALVRVWPLGQVLAVPDRGGIGSGHRAPPCRSASFGNPVNTTRRDLASQARASETAKPHRFRLARTRILLSTDPPPKGVTAMSRIRALNQDERDTDSPIRAVATLISAATTSWATTLRFTMACSALALPATAVIILFLLI